jgi:DNA-binding transcriptional regulator YiaG
MAGKQKYQSEILGVIYEDALADFRVGAISEERLREYAEGCLVKPPVPRTATQKPAPAFADSGAPVYARGK